MMARLAKVCLLTAGLAMANAAWADPPCAGDCPRPSYSPLRYWAPRVPRAGDWCHGPWLSVTAPDRHPEIPPDFIHIRYHCPAAGPAMTRIQSPTPPPESKFHY